MWQNVFFEWERCNILDGSWDVPTHSPKLIRKYVFGCLANLKEKQLEKLAKAFLSKAITLKEHPCTSSEGCLNGRLWFRTKLWIILDIPNQPLIIWNHIWTMNGTHWKTSTSLTRCFQFWIQSWMMISIWKSWGSIA